MKEENEEKEKEAQNYRFKHIVVYSASKLSSFLENLAHVIFKYGWCKIRSRYLYGVVDDVCNVKLGNYRIESSPIYK